MLLDILGQVSSPCAKVWLKSQLGTGLIYIYIGESVCVCVCVCVRVCVYPSDGIHVVACGPIGTKFCTHIQIHLQMVVS